jgi:hypothetical protein
MALLSTTTSLFEWTAVMKDILSLPRIFFSKEKKKKILLSIRGAWVSTVGVSESCLFYPMITNSNYLREKLFNRTYMAFC